MRRISLLWILGGVLWAEEFLISYKAKMRNELLVGEEYRVSQVLSAKGERGLNAGELKKNKTCEIFSLENFTLKENLKMQKEQVLECLYSSGVSLEDHTLTKNGEARSQTILKIPPKRVIATLENGVIKLNVLEKK